MDKLCGSEAQESPEAYYERRLCARFDLGERPPVAPVLLFSSVGDATLRLIESHLFAARIRTNKVGQVCTKPTCGLNSRFAQAIRWHQSRGMGAEAGTRLQMSVVVTRGEHRTGAEHGRAMRHMPCTVINHSAGVVRAPSLSNDSRAVPYSGPSAPRRQVATMGPAKAWVKLRVLP